ncbi:hypothetical protein D1823_16100 [Ruegeria sp. AD91A]|uniref:hypothetical protein n=1 Tax=Ruegeria sp. AD91A TaxID=2293862 RepID=UPI000E52E82B|nr:hypothetical protein [Ruegeria sp. AD91A]AXT27950.1 hypothetical protein D1823_16100 [Ruegeria sp. AD91A]
MDRTLIPFAWTFSSAAEASTSPERKPMRAPVFIHDAVTPWGDETMLLKLFREQAADQEE